TAQYALFFFFQAEDGIRDFHVTGVQTCALPISGRYWSTSWRRPPPPAWRMYCWSPGGARPRWWTTSTAGLTWRRCWRPRVTRPRSEERRVGKECRSRGPRQKEKNTSRWRG